MSELHMEHNFALPPFMTGHNVCRRLKAGKMAQPEIQIRKRVCAVVQQWYNTSPLSGEQQLCRAGQ